MKKLYYLFLTLLPFGTIVPSIAQKITDNQISKQGDYTYELWKQDGTGSGSMTLGTGGNFSCEWTGITNFLARKGLRPGSKNVIVQYSATYNPNGNSYLCVYGWTTDPLIEYYIVDSWGSWRPPSGTPLGTVKSDSGTYDIYRTQRVNQPSIHGDTTFYQYWSVRQSKRSSGTITCANHFNAWANLGLEIGDFYEVSLTVEGYKSSGTADITMSMTTSSSLPDNALSKTEFYPNPVNDVLRIELPTNNLELSLIDSEGRQVFKTINKTLIQTIDMADMKSGLYVLRITNQNSVVTHKVLKQ